MTTHSTSRVRRYAAVGTAVAIVAGSSAFGLGLGATTASAAEPEPAAATSAASTTSAASAASAAGTTPGAPATPEVAPTDGTTAPVPADEPAGDTAPAGTDTPADDAATPDDAVPADDAPADDAAPTGETSAEGGPDVTTDAVTPAGTVAVTGTTTIFHTLSASADGWPADTTFTYQWVFTDRDGTTDVAGATTDTYVVDPQDVDGTVQVRVTGTAPGEDPTTVTSAATAPVKDDPAIGFRTLAIRDVTTRVGEPFSVSLAAFEGDGLQYFVNDQPGGSSNPGVLPAGVSFSPDGTLSGTPTVAGYTMLWVHASTSRHPDGGTAMRVFFTTEAAPAVSMRVWAYTSTDDRPYDLWQIAPDGSTRYTSNPQDWYGDPATPLRVPQTAEVNLDVAGTDAFGDTVLFEDGGVRWSSSVAGDAFDTSLSPGALDAGAARLTFAHASEHVITATHGDLSISFTIDVTPTATTVVATKPASGTGQLAYTGADATGPIAWALGLLAAGGTLLVHRARRRRA
jgi:hypothetical protein